LLKKLEIAIQKLNIRVVCLDHLQRCNIPNRRGENDAKAIEEFVFRLADTAKEYNIALIILMSEMALGWSSVVPSMNYLNTPLAPTIPMFIMAYNFFVLVWTT
jgi:hypothetical protein